MAGASEPSEVGDRAVRLIRVDRRQLCWEMLDVERLIEDDHPALAIWELTGRLDLEGFSTDIRSVDGGAGRPAHDPRLLIGLWVYAYGRGTGSACEVALSSRVRPSLPLADRPDAGEPSHPVGLLGGSPSCA